MFDIYLTSTENFLIEKQYDFTILLRIYQSRNARNILILTINSAIIMVNICLERNSAMKKTIKKLGTLALIITLLPSLLTVNVNAYRIGDVINYAQPTNIAASINGYQLMSYNVDGYTYIVAEDLNYYGFTVSYDYSNRRLSVARDYSVSAIYPQQTNPNFSQIGKNKTRRNILYTDITTSVNGQLVNSYNIDGSTIIPFDELAKFGDVIYSDVKREISLTLLDLPYNKVALLANSFYDTGAVDQMRSSYETAMKRLLGNHISCTFYIRAKGDFLNYEFYLYGVSMNAQDKAAFQSGLSSTQYTIKSAYQEIKSYMPELAGVSTTVYDSNNTELASLVVYLD